MRTIRISPRSGLVVAAVAVPLALAAGPATAAGGGISVSVTGTTVMVSTTACPSGGKAALMSNGSANFAQGKQVDLAGGSSSQSASWTGVSPGTHTVAVVCSGGASAGAAQVTVSGSTASPTPRPTSTSVPRGLARGGLGGGAHGDTAGQIAAGAALAVVTGVGGTWLMRRRRSRRTLPPV